MASLDNELKSHFVHATDELEWVPLSLTLVEYPQGKDFPILPHSKKRIRRQSEVDMCDYAITSDMNIITLLPVLVTGDTFGKLLALISLTPFAILTGFVTLILFRRDLHTIAFFSGVMLNEFVNFILKHTIREARPLKREGLHSEYGMPSTHAQFIWFFAAYVTLFVCIRLHHNSNSTISERFWRIIIVVACIVLAILVSYSRIYLQYHSISQILCGVFVGATLGVAWFLITHTILTPLFPLIVSWRISEYLLLRDTTLIPNVLWFEYTNIRTEVRARSRKLVSMKSQ